ncbi:ABC transporter permease [Thiocapsa imhoffii]|uniref:ABC transporter permease n=1 Tax=Thiocapsa imhoffii TaxID=382777 RepID=A0A9X0WG80_9GAMM|nr:ABC transporter permease [Thiocapsa imhoffii]MBK1643597.1 ABC transporter permease [Thiocapsa imhoffii]
MAFTRHPLLRHLFLASLWRRPLATALTLLAMTLGVALGLAVQLIHATALDEFGRGLRLLGGEADLQVVGARAGFDDDWYLWLAQRPEVAVASPLLEIEARLPGQDRTLRIIGLDLFRVGAITPALLPRVDRTDDADPARTDAPHPNRDPDATASSDQAAAPPRTVATDGPDRLAVLRPDALFLSPTAARQITPAPGATIAVQVGLSERHLRYAGSVPGAGVGTALAVMDIGAAQQTFERIGRLTRVDLRLAPGITREAAQALLNAELPAGLRALTPADAASEALGLSRAYRVNLTMLAAIALVTGGFLVFSAQWLSVVRRRQEFALLRALGLDRRFLWRALLAEGATLGLIGGLLGVVLAYLMTALAFRVLGGDLGPGFFRGLAPPLRFEPFLTLLYLGLGICAGIIGAWFPAREAARMCPARALRAGDEAESYRAHPRWRLTSATLLLAAGLCVLPPVQGIPVFGYLAVALLLLGAVLALPGMTGVAMRLLGNGHGLIPRLARARLAAAPGQAVIAGAGVVASVALAVSMVIMVASFRDSLDAWLGTMLPADLYLRASAATASGALDEDAVARVSALPDVVGVRPVRFETVRLDRLPEPVELIARPVSTTSGLPLVAGRITASSRPADPTVATTLTSRSALPPAWISEALADRGELGLGDRLDLPLGEALHGFRIDGIWRDYARQQGAIVIELDDFRAITQDRLTNDLGLFLADGADPEAVMQTVRDTLGERVSEMIRPEALRGMILEVFDRTFLVTYLMQAVAVMIGLFGIGTTFAALATSRRKEFGILRHLGLERRQIGALLATEAALTAGVGVLVGLAAGGAIGIILIEVVNRQSFHWSMDIQIPTGVLAVFALTLIILAALAARLSGREAMRQDAVLAVREDW